MYKTKKALLPVQSQKRLRRYEEFISHDTSFCLFVTACLVAEALCKTCGKFYFSCNALCLATSGLLLAFIQFYPLLFDL